MLIVALVLAVIGLAALVTAVVTSNELIAWVCIGASVIGVVLLIVDALRERSRTTEGDVDADDTHDHDTTVMPAVPESEVTEDYPDEPSDAETTVSHVEHDEPETSAVGVEAHDEATTTKDARD
ncbi:hypothetical protein MMAD_34160 [Mycolicibacterium madagascariense]|uniref:Transmembrane protein n=1 Tax=Mycolicibacterium madagascariense TaxID=212765 RepID=A0A7I7XIU6_9MYCO|nr:DUF308 domain-containing protein [Mycolicibacterium madagascariense]MCV7010981.1 DUF308 domain-containing protein [Mycolicibacterium madagascariense]BBZ29121.1 hypothetical protein MMAD_34160 [Mycolicibacterium madagascariense]